ncbi:hypothetical protein D3C80_1091010 [compost metagenome]
MSYAIPFLAHQPGAGILEFYFAAGVGPVAQLILQPFQPYGIACAVRQNSRQEETGQPIFGLRQHQVRIALRYREKPLVADQTVGFSWAACTQRAGGGGITQHIGTALLFGHSHADQQTALLPAGQ